VSWTLLMEGYINAVEPKMALWLFVINACSVLVDLEVGLGLTSGVLGL